MFRIFLTFVFVSLTQGYVLERHLSVIPAAIPSAGKIIGGEITSIEDVPYQVVLFLGEVFICGGSIVKPKAVITSAHCTLGYAPSWISIRAGSSFYNSGGQLIPSSRIFNHEAFTPTTSDYDICVLELSRAIAFSSSAAPITLPTQGLNVPAGSSSQTSGWGWDGQSVSQVIRRVTIPIVDQDICNEVFNNIGYFVTRRMICAGLIEEGGKDACFGDSGGPLVVKSTLIGVTSWGYECAKPGFPGVYTRVPELQNWIDDKLSQIV